VWASVADAPTAAALAREASLASPAARALNLTPPLTLLAPRPRRCDQVLLAHFLCGRRKPGGWDSGVVMQGQLLVFSG
jgi:hypothetical protein